MGSREQRSCDTLRGFPFKGIGVSREKVRFRDFAFGVRTGMVKNTSVRASKLRLRRPAESSRLRETADTRTGHFINFIRIIQAHAVVPLTIFYVLICCLLQCF